MNTAFRSLVLRAASPISIGFAMLLVASPARAVVFTQSDQVMHDLVSGAFPAAGVGDEAQGLPGVSGLLFGDAVVALDDGGGGGSGGDTGSGGGPGGDPAPVPEPATWAMLVAGFGLLGWTMRRNRTGISYVSA